MVEILNPEQKEYKEQGKQISDAIKNSDIKALQQLLPTAEDLVNATEYCYDRNHDIMDQITLSGNHEMLKKILNTYFSDRSEENDDLRRRFLLSYERDNGQPKNFHYFSDLPPLVAYKKYALSKTEEEQEKNTQEFYRINEAFNSPTDNKDKQFEQEKMEVYRTIRNAYMEVYPQTNPHEQMKTKFNIEKYNLAHKNKPYGELTNSTSQKTPNSLETKTFNFTYPKIRLVDIPEDQDANIQLLCPCFDITDTKFTEGKNDLAEQVLNKMDFPDTWISNNFFIFINKLGATYQKLHNDEPIADAVVRNFNKNKFFSLENRKDKTMITAQKDQNGEYGGYQSSEYICLRTDDLYNEGTVLHEGTHNTDGREFSKSDLYEFIATAIYANPEKSTERSIAVNTTLTWYERSQFEVETLARIPQQYFTSENFKNDPLLKATFDIFAAYGKAKEEGNNNILNRINLCMLRHLNEDNRYTKFSHVNDLRLDYFNETDIAGYSRFNISKNPTLLENELQEKRENFLNEYKQLTGSEQKNEDMIINCINTELKAIEKINQYPSVKNITLDTTTILRDYTTKEEPLEVLIAKTYESTKKISSLRAQKMSEQELAEESKKHTIMGKETVNELEKDRNNYTWLNRELYCDAIKHTVTAAMYTSFLAEKYFSQKTFDENIQAYIPNKYIFGEKSASTTLNEVSRLQNNIQIINNANPEMCVLPEMFDNPLSLMQHKINNGKDNYEYNKNLIDPQQRIEDMKEVFSKKNPIENMRFMQLLYKEVNPQAKSLPEDLHFATLTKEKIKNGEWENTVNKYQAQFVKQLEKQARNSQTQAPISKNSSHSL